MSKSIYKIPEDFVSVCKDAQDKNLYCVEYLRKRYRVNARNTIEQWLTYVNLPIIYFSPNVDEVRELARDNTKQDIIRHYGVSPRVITKFIEKHNIVCKDFVRYNFDVDKEEFLSVFSESKSIQDLIDRFGVARSMICSYMDRNGIQYEKRFGNKISKSKEDKILDKCLKGFSIGDIVKETRISVSTIDRIVKENGIRRPRTLKEDKDEEFRQVLENIDNYYQTNQQNVSLGEIAVAENISVHFLKQAFKERGLVPKNISHNRSKGELEVKEFIQSLGFSCESVKRLYDGKRFEIDCFVEEKMLGIEYCGEYWHSFNNGTPKSYHKDKYDWCSAQGISLMTIFEHEWLYKRDIIESMIKNKLGLSERLFARKTTVSEIDAHKAKKFHNENHINGYVNSSLNYGLYYNDELVSVLSLSMSRFDKTSDYEITRLSTKKGINVVGGFSKLLKYANCTSLMTYADLRFGDGGVYEKNGFKKQGSTSPNYWYFEKGGYGFDSRMKYQKKKLTAFANYSDDKTEYDIMEENGFLRIYDCGSAKYKLEL